MRTVDAEHDAETIATTLAALTRELERALVTCVWTQWKLIGGTAAARRPALVASPIDPEAVLLASLGLLEAEPRLIDVLRGWVRANAARVSVQRVRNLTPHYAHLATEDGQRRLAWLAQIARTEAKDARWRGLATAATVAPDEFATAQRASRPRTKSPPPELRPTDPPHLMLRLRLGLGVGIKADVIAFLLGQGGAWRTVREIARALTYTVAPVRSALDDLAAAAFIDRRLGHPVRYGTSAARWQALLGGAIADSGWGCWDERFRFGAEWLAWARAPRLVPLTPYVFSVQARELFARHRGAFGSWEVQSERTGGDTDAMLDAVARDVGGFSDALRTPGAATGAGGRGV